MVNTIYLIVAILMFISWTQYFGNEQQAGIWIKRFYYVMKGVFLISNIIFLIALKKNEYFEYAVFKSTNTGEILLSIGYILFVIPIIIYIVDLISFLLKRKVLSSIYILWIVYLVVLIVSIVYSPCIKSENVIQERESIVSYREEVVKSTFISDSVDGIDYIIKQQNSDGREKDEIIKTRTYKDEVKVEIYPHQESSYIEKYITVETHIRFFGNVYEKGTDKTIYKIYLTDELYQNK